MNTRLYTLIVITLLLSSASIITASGDNTTSHQASSIQEDILEMIEQINETQLYSYHHGLVKFGPRYTGSINCTLAANYLYESFETIGLSVEFHDWHYAGFRSTNVVATLPGNDPTSDAIIIISGHYDTVQGAPGADDDASGAAALLMLAQVMKNYSFNHTIRFIAFSGEEVGTFGSFSYARDAYRRGDNILAVLNLDMIGFASTTDGGRILRFFPPERSQWMAEDATRIADDYYDHLDMTIETLPSYIGADNQPFVDYGYDGVWIAHRDGYPYGHSPEDTAEHLNWTYYTKATKLMCAVLAEFALQPLPVQVIITAPLEGKGYVFNKPVMKLDLGKFWYARWRGATVLLGRAVASADIRTTEPLRYVIFCIDGNFMFWDSEPPYEWKIQGLHWPLFGRHTLKVYAYTENGHIASDQMDLRIFTLSYQYGLW